VDASRAAGAGLVFRWIEADAKEQAFQRVGAAAIAMFGMSPSTWLFGKWSDPSACGLSTHGATVGSTN
jgi:hypothetical protein